MTKCNFVIVRYWLMSSCPGIVVEVTPTLPPIAKGNGIASSWADYSIPSYVKRPQLKDFLNSSDDSSAPTGNGTNGSATNGNGSISNGNGSKNGTPTPSQSSMEVDKEEVDEREVKLEKSKKWSFSPNTSGTEWLCYRNESDLRQLHASLNSRGEREKSLKEQIQRYFNCMQLGNSGKVYSFSKGETGKDDAAFEAGEKDILSYRDYILDIEERIFQADFGDAFNDEEEREQVTSPTTHFT